MPAPIQTPPQITINGKKYTMPKPKIKLWRLMVKFHEAQQNGELTTDSMFDEMINLVVAAFKNQDVTAEAVEENVDFEELAKLFNYIGSHVNGVAYGKAAQIPNVKTPAGT